MKTTDYMMYNLDRLLTDQYLNTEFTNQGYYSAIYTCGTMQ